MKIENQIFKNYKELCSKLKIPVCTGYSKQKQLRELEEKYEILRDGRAFTIVRTKEVKPKPSACLSHNAKYIDFIQHILLSYLSEQKEEVAYLTQQHLWCILGLVNDYYLEAKKSPSSLLKLDEDMTIFDVNSFFQRSGMKFRDILKSSLTSLKRRKLIMSEETFRIGNANSHGYIEYHDASDDEKRYILRTQRNLLTEMGYKDEFELFCSKDRDAYYKKLHDILYEQEGWENIFSCYKIIFNRDCVLEEVDVNSEKYKLNQTVLKTLDTQADSLYEKRNITTCKPDEFFFQEEYPRKQKVLSHELVLIKDLISK